MISSAITYAFPPRDTVHRKFIIANASYYTKRQAAGKNLSCYRQ